MSAVTGGDGAANAAKQADAANNTATQKQAGQRADDALAAAAKVGRCRFTPVETRVESAWIQHLKL
jgi:hypothetical protein